MIVTILDQYSPGTAVNGTTTLLQLQVITNGLENAANASKWTSIFRGQWESRGTSRADLYFAERPGDVFRSTQAFDVDGVKDRTFAAAAKYYRVNRVNTWVSGAKFSLWFHFAYLPSGLIVTSAHATTGYTVGEDILKKPGAVILG